MKTIDVLDLPEEAREFVRECEVRGERTLLQRGGRSVAMLVSYDEYLALRETVEIANDAELGAALNAAAEEEPLRRSDRIWFAPSAEQLNLSDHERVSLDGALQMIDDDPIAGAPLFEPLKGLWVYRAEHLRVLYRVVPEMGGVVVLSVTRTAL